MDKLKPYAVPVIALLLLLLWYFAVQPRLVADKPLDDSATQERVPSP